MPIVWEFPDGHLELTTLAEEVLERTQLPQETRSQAVLRLAQEVAEKAPHLKLATPTLVASKDVPSDRSHRNQWTLVDGRIEVPHV